FQVIISGRFWVIAEGYCLGAFLQAARNVSWVLQKEKGVFTDFSWYDEWREKAKNDPVLKIRELVEGGYIERAEPVVLMGECGTGKTHLATGLCVAACRQKRRARFTTAANLVNELVEARQHNAVKRVLARWLRYDVIVLDEVGYVPLADIGAEFLFQVIAERAERATLIVTTNLPFSEWTQVFPNPRLCKALLDRITDRAHIIETGTESYRFRRTLEVRQKKKAS
ncbi:MAG: ATP-binding protein, partial [Terriglobales bacterium]